MQRQYTWAAAVCGMLAAGCATSGPSTRTPGPTPAAPDRPTMTGFASDWQRMSYAIGMRMAEQLLRSQEVAANRDEVEAGAAAAFGLTPPKRPADVAREDFKAYERWISAGQPDGGPRVEAGRLAYAVGLHFGGQAVEAWPRIDRRAVWAGLAAGLGLTEPLLTDDEVEAQMQIAHELEGTDAGPGAAAAPKPPPPLAKPKPKIDLSGEISRMSYAVGMDLGATAKRSNFEPQPESFRRGIEDVLGGQATDETHAASMSLLKKHRDWNGLLIFERANPDPPASEAELSHAIAVLGLYPYRETIPEIDVDAMVAGLLAGAGGTNPLLSDEQKAEAHKAYIAIIEENQAAAADAFKKANAAYLRQNAKKPGVTTTDGGAQVEILRPGKGERPSEGDYVTVKYQGRLIDGTVFDTSGSNADATFGFTVGEDVIPGWTEGVQRMKPGGRYRLTVPADLAYGERGISRVPGNATLVFDIELVDVIYK